MSISSATDSTNVEALVAALPRGETIASPYALYDALRPHAPVSGYRDYPPGTIPGVDEAVSAWVLLDYDHVSKAARDHRLYSSRDPLQEQSSAPTLMLVNHDNPEHDRLRGIVNLAFSRRRVEALDPWVREMVDELVASYANSQLEVTRDLASVIPARVIAGLLGLDESVHDRFRDWGTAFMLSADLTPEERQKSNMAIVDFFVATASELQAKIEKGQEVPDGLIAALLRAETEEGKLTLDEVIRFCITLVVAGAETTTFLLGNLVYNLVTMPEIRRQLAADRSLVPAFIDESLRHSGPPQRLVRIATADIEIGGCQIKEGDWGALFFAAANHDPKVFPDPERFDITRPNLNKQLTFGVGIHHCLGSAVARMEARSLINAVLDQWDELSLTSDPVKQRASLLNHGFDQIHISVTSKGRAA